MDHDGIAELFIYSLDYVGQACTPYLVFKRSGKQYRYVGCLDAGRYKVLPLGADGRSRIAVYTRLEPGVGSISVWTNNGKEFVMLADERVFGGDGGTEEQYRRFREVFGDD
ncbi:MAG: hypothetical protein NTW87_27100 [Planctomycetota bacterium]|nr:hypothetical protein [Planctomycetota bacterium]